MRSVRTIIASGTLYTIAMELLWMLLAGLVAGLLAGLLGVGGGIIFTPLLFFVFESAGRSEPHLWAVGTSLLCTFSASSGAISKILTRSELNWRSAAFLAISGALGTQVGKLLLTSKWYTQQAFRMFFSLILLFTVINYLVKMLRKSSAEGEKEELRPPIAMVSGVFGGFVATLAGVGGGIVMVPLLNIAAKVRFRLATSYSQAAIILISFTATITLAIGAHPQASIPYSVGFVDVQTALPLLIGAFVASRAGVQYSDKIPRPALLGLFTLFAGSVLVKMVFF